MNNNDKVKTLILSQISSRAFETTYKISKARSIDYWISLYNIAVGISL